MIEKKQIIRSAAILIILYLFFLFSKKIFFISLFVVLNYLVLVFKIKYGFDLPIEVISFATFMCGFIYGPIEAIIIVGFSFINLALTGRFDTHNTINNLFLIGIGIFAHFFSHAPIAYVGISCLILRYIFDFLFNIIVLSDPNYIRKIPKRIFNCFSIH